MTAILNLWAAITGLAASLTRTKELIDAGNARLETSLGIDAPAPKMIDVADDTETPPETSRRRKATA